MFKLNRQLFFEFVRYLLVGGTAFLLDFGVMVLFKEYFFHGEHVYIAVSIGYTVGLIYNFILSCGFVYKNGFKKIKNKELYSFIIFTLVGTVGFGLTELFMYIFINIFLINYLIAKIISAAIVVFWNYIGRKLTIYK